jgi:GT2 family glycosyltransferase
MTYWDHDQNREVDWLSGSFMLIRKNDFENIGRFDEDYFIYSEDTDLCLRLNRAEYRNYYYSKYTIIHHDAGIAGKNMALRESRLWRSRRYYFLKNYSVAHSKIFSFLYFIYIINRIIMFAFLTVAKKNKTQYRDRLTDYSNALKLYFSVR